jgi:hypothetical protein
MALRKGYKRRRNPEAVERDARAVELRRRNLSYRQIAKELDYRSTDGAVKAVQRGLADSVVETNDEVRQQELDRLDDLARGALRVMARVHYATSGGKVMKHPDTGELLIDDAPVLNAIDRLIKIMERRARYLGLDAPQKVEMTSIGMVESEISKLTRELEAAGVDVSRIDTPSVIKGSVER